MDSSKIEISRKDYDELCHRVRHLITKNEQAEKRNDKMFELIIELSKEIQVKRKEIQDYIRSLESFFNKMCELNGDESEEK